MAKIKNKINNMLKSYFRALKEVFANNKNSYNNNSENPFI